MIVVDTSVWIDYVNGIISPQTDILDNLLREQRIVTGDLVITEFLQGFKNEKEYQQAKQLMDSLEYFDFVGKTLAIKAAQNFRKLRRNGITIRKTIDVLIATFCIEHHMPLLHSDHDYDLMEKIIGLQILR